MNIILQTSILSFLISSIAFGGLFYSSTKSEPLVSLGKTHIPQILETTNLVLDSIQEYLYSGEILDEDIVVSTLSANQKVEEIGDFSFPQIKHLNKKIVPKEKDFSEELQGDSYQSCQVPLDLKESKSFVSTEFILTSSQINFSGDIVDRQIPFQIEFNDSREAWVSNQLGVVRKSIDHHVSEVRQARVDIEDFVPLNFELHFNEDFYQFAIPLFEEAAFKKLRDKTKRIKKGHLLLGIDEQLEFIDIEAEYEEGIYLDSLFRPTKNPQNYQYLLFMGIKPGITQLVAKGNSNRELTKEVFIHNGEITFDFLSLGAELNQRNQLCVSFPYQKNKFSELNLALEPLVSIRDSQLEMLGLNTFNLFSLDRLTGSQDRLILERSDNPKVKFNPRQSESVILPSTEEVDYILKEFKVGEKFEGCALQLNFSQSVEDIDFEIFDTFGRVQSDFLVMQPDGELTQDILPQSRRFYLYHNEPSMMNIRVRFLDGSTDYLTEYCKEGNFSINSL